MEYGYVRVSTREQNEDKQMVAIRKFGIAEDRIVLDKQSGKDFERPGYRRLTKEKGGPWWCWICPCWTPARGGT